jgi:hypothetical protein
MERTFKFVGFHCIEGSGEVAVEVALIASDGAKTTLIIDYDSYTEMEVLATKYDTSISTVVEVFINQAITREKAHLQ